MRLAVSRSPLIAIPEPRLVPVRVLENSPAGRSSVYGLTVYGRPEYLADGVLVRNCLDALRYVVMSRPGAPKPTPVKTDDDRLKRFRANLQRDKMNTEMGNIFQ